MGSPWEAPYLMKQNLTLPESGNMILSWEDSVQKASVGFETKKPNLQLEICLFSN